MRHEGFEVRKIRTLENLVSEVPRYPIHAAALDGAIKRAQERGETDTHVFIKHGEEMYDAEIANIFTRDGETYEIKFVNGAELKLESDEEVEVFGVKSLSPGEIQAGDYVLNGVRKSLVTQVLKDDPTGDGEVRVMLEGRTALTYNKDDKSVVVFRPVNV